MNIFEELIFFKNYMPVCYVKRAVEILREEGLVEFAYASYHFLRRIINSPRRLVITKTYWGWKYHKRQLRTQVANETDADPFKIIWVNPNRIQYICGGYKHVPDSDTPNIKHFNYQFRPSTIGEVKNGDWDTHEDKFEEHPRFIGIYQRYIKEMPWEETDYFQNHIKIIESEGRSFKYESQEELLQKCNQYEQLLYEIKENGYKTHRELGNLSLNNEIGVSIGRNGEFFFTERGAHRLSIAKVLDLDEVPVIVRIRHTRWQELRDKIHNDGLPEEYEDLRDHPDLQDVIDD